MMRTDLSLQSSSTTRRHNVISCSDHGCREGYCANSGQCQVTHVSRAPTCSCGQQWRGRRCMKKRKSNRKRQCLWKTRTSGLRSRMKFSSKTTNSSLLCRRKSDTWSWLNSSAQTRPTKTVTREPSNLKSRRLTKRPRWQCLAARSVARGPRKRWRCLQSPPPKPPCRPRR